jgi:predicted 3-demethylubiquinone-9 3-methyltransferase (glyoxalase superfamily)
MKKITPCLWFDGKAEEAMNFYASVFKNFERLGISHYGQAGPGEKGSVLSVTFRIENQDFMALNGGPHYTFTPAISLLVTCETQDEIDAYWEKLSVGGKPLKCGWITDKYGVTWQIVPAILGALLQDKDAAKSRRAMVAMLKMVKLDIAALERAHAGG